MGQVESASLQQNIDSKRTFSPGPHLEELVRPSSHHRHLQHLLQLHLHPGTQAPQPQPATYYVIHDLQLYTFQIVRPAKRDTIHDNIC